jgi:hypothetical protein
MKLTNYIRDTLLDEIKVRLDQSSAAVTAEGLTKRILKEYQVFVLPIGPKTAASKLKAHLVQDTGLTVAGRYEPKAEIYGKPPHYRSLTNSKEAIKAKLPQGIIDDIVELERLYQNESKLIDEAKKFLSTCNTTKQLFEAWPEIETFFRERFNMTDLTGKGMVIFSPPSEALKSAFQVKPKKNKKVTKP